MNKIIPIAILALSLSSLVNADECTYWNEILDLGIPEVSEIATPQVEYVTYQGVDAYYQTYYYD